MTNRSLCLCLSLCVSVARIYICSYTDVSSVPLEPTRWAHMATVELNFLGNRTHFRVHVLSHWQEREESLWFGAESTPVSPIERLVSITGRYDRTKYACFWTHKGKRWIMIWCGELISIGNINSHFHTQRVCVTQRELTFNLSVSLKTDKRWKALLTANVQTHFK